MVHPQVVDGGDSLQIWRIATYTEYAAVDGRQGAVL